MYMGAYKYISICVSISKYSYLCVFKTHTCKYICIPHILCNVYKYSYK